MPKLTLIFVLSLTVFIQASFAVSLEDSFSSALQTNVTDKLNESRVNLSVERKKQEQSSLYPTLSARSQYNKQENIDGQTSAGLNLVHSLYSGGRNGAAIDNAETSVQIARNQKQIDRLFLYLNVIESYYTYFLNLNDLNNLELFKKQSRERSEEIRKRVQIGRSRRGELLQAEAQLASVEAQSFNGLGLKNESEAVFTLLTGVPSNNPPHVDLSFNQTIQTARPLEDYVGRALNKEDVINRRLEIERIERDLRVSRNHYLPTLDLSSNYFVHRNGGVSLYRNTAWDVGVVLSIPLFQGGYSQSLVRENLERRQTASYALTDFEKNIKIEVSRRYEIYRRFNDQIKAYDLAMDKGKRSYDEAIKDYRLGLISNLEVLSALNIYLDNKRNAEKTRIQAMMNQKMLEAVAGEIP